MKRGLVRGIVGVVAGLAILAGCTQRAEPPAAVAPPPPPVIIAPPGAGMHDNLSGPKAVWHMRAALNVAALSCAGRNGQIVQDYNRILARHKVQLAAGYDAETAAAQQVHGANFRPALDRHMTQLYNYFAWPPAQDAFCREAGALAAEGVQVPPAQFEAFSQRGLRRIEAAFVAPVAAHHVAAVTPSKSAPRAARTTTPAAAPAKSAPAARMASAGNWRIQVGAFTGRAAAEAAWAQVRTRSPGLAAYAPLYEPVPRRPQLVRLQLAAGEDKASALRLCALASAAGFACLPVGS